MMFDSFEAYDIQETRHVSREEGRIEGERAGRIEGEQLYLIKQLLLQTSATLYEVQRLYNHTRTLHRLHGLLPEEVQASLLLRLPFQMPY